MPDPFLDSLVAAIPLPALAIDRTERIVAANDDALSLVGKNARDKHYVTMLRQPMLLEAIEGALEDGQSRNTHYLGNDGARNTTFAVSCRAIAAVGQANAGAVLIVFQDISHKEDADQMRRDFVANASHELRTPLTSIIGFIETLRGPARNDPQAADRFLGIMQVEAARMNRLLGDLMSLNRVESNERVRPTEEVVLGDLLESTMRALKHLAKEAEVVFDTDLPVRPVVLTADPDQLRQVFTNLIENAIKYGASGKRVTVRLTYHDREPNLRMPGARVDIIDYGPGIDPDHIPRLTERFYRGDDHRSRELGGTGLGLAIVKHIINRHRGRLRIESEVGTGSCFTILLPVVFRES